MGKNKINIALFGLGRIGQMHAENLINHPQFYLKYIFDIDKNLTEKLSKKYKCISIKNPNIAFRDKNIKSIFIATSTKTHLRFIEEGVKNKKVIFCEKPLDLDLKKINQSKKKLAKLNPKIQMGFNRFYYIYLTIIFFQMFYLQLKNLKIKNAESCLSVFKSNNILGGLVLIGLIIGKVY